MKIHAPELHNLGSRCINYAQLIHEKLAKIDHDLLPQAAHAGNNETQQNHVHNFSRNLQAALGSIVNHASSYENTGTQFIKNAREYVRIDSDNRP